MVKIGARVLKIGVHLRFDPKFTVEFEHFDQIYSGRCKSRVRIRICRPLTLLLCRELTHSTLVYQIGSADGRGEYSSMLHCLSPPA